ncbi:hypothetical protein LEP1GSC050_3773 [Leptospira broomii serovar Hurstbridge str. 5399]|uniref:PF07611 family protein n=1 Tax=Leptospira broomii serovar Hurstbridge str. 5399 TaxID=1049789 RepID=T0GH43_9LEPT|nr:hypothetical protein [Leptospira broomii]EQA46164.1 hypothetical protein LEP1GSC050_3773 [Leptospira broomii serovar Hurstbridge str. 5399]
MRSKLTGLILAVLFFLILEGIVRILPSHYMEEPETFFVNYKKNSIESGSGTADVIILGDSRSMALSGKAKDKSGDYAVYNHSLPAMGPRYYKFLIEKYLRFGNKKPKLLLFAASHVLYSQGYGFPLYDPSGQKTAKNESVPMYIDRRWNEGWQNTFFKRPTASSLDPLDPQAADTFLWDFFGQRYLHQFSFAELAGQFQGVERIFILSKAAPILYSTYKFRKSVINAFTFSNWKTERDSSEWIKTCSSCDAIEAGQCLPAGSQLQDNFRIQEWLDTYYGKYNISNRMNPLQTFQSREYVKHILQKSIESQNIVTPHDYSSLIELIEFCEKEGILFGFLYMPGIQELENTKNSKAIYSEVEALIKGRKNAEFFSFPSAGYPKELFVDLIHFDCRGEERLNREFHELVLPKVYKFLDEHSLHPSL